MGHFRFHRSIGNKFVRLNISKKGFSLTGGIPGAHINVPIAGRKRKAMFTGSLPGTGLSYRQTFGPTRSSSPRVQDSVSSIIAAMIVIAVVSFFVHAMF